MFVGGVALVFVFLSAMPTVLGRTLAANQFWRERVVGVLLLTEEFTRLANWLLTFTPVWVWERL